MKREEITVSGQSGLIYSNEKNSAKWILGLAFVQLIAVLTLLYMVWRSWSFEIFVVALGFLLMFLVLFCIGKYHHNLFQALGETPLLLEPEHCVCGERTKATIFVSQRDFSRVSSLKFRCMREDKSQTTRTEVLYEYHYTVEPANEADGTRLEFEIETQAQDPATSRLFTTSAVRIRWELSFEYVEKMERIRRTWDVPVVRSKAA